MYYYSDQWTTSAEDMVSDFLHDKKAKEISPKPSEPAYKGTSVEPNQWEAPTLATLSTEQTVQAVAETHETFTDADMKDLNNLQRICGSVHKNFAESIRDTLEKYNFEGSPIYEDEVSQKILLELIETALRKCAENVDEIGVICSQEHHNAYSQHSLLRSLFEFMILNELFLLRRIRERRIKTYEIYS